ncbi:MAG: Bug family tripartite tricarboxylate transporter substrate binding protein [Rhodospirillaceae bacterium]
MRFQSTWLAVVAICSFVCSPVRSQQPAADYPVKPIRFIVPTSPGGGVDTVSRLIGQKLTDAWGQQVIIDNRGGASGIIGTELAARSAADGYTFLIVPTTFSVNPSLFRKLPYDPVKDLIPVSLISKEPNVLVVHPSLPVSSVKTLVDLSRRSAQKINYGYGGPGSSSNLSAELFKLKTGAKGVGVSYKSAGPAVNALLAGETQMMFIGLPPTLPSIKGAKLRALAVTTQSRSPLLPDIPTMIESGVPGFEVTNWIGMMTPAGTRDEIVRRINAAITNILSSPTTRERMLFYGITPDGSTPEAFGEFVRSEIARWAEVVRKAGVTVN